MAIPEHLQAKTIGHATFQFDVMLGRVAAEKKWSETRVWGGGGDGHVGRRGGHLNPVRVHSAVDLNQEIWLELPDGSPHCLQVTNMNVQALEGHPLSVIRVRAKGSRHEGVGSVCNLATGIHFDDAALCQHLAKTYASSSLTRGALSLLAVLVAGATIWSGTWLLGLFLLPAGLALAKAIAQGQCEEKARLIRQHLASVQKWVVDEMVFRANADVATVVDPSEAPQPYLPVAANPVHRQ